MSDLLLNLYKKIYLIRSTEQSIRDEYSKDEMKTPMHMSMGSEAISAGVVLALNSNAHYFGTYRSHALYLAITEETDKFFGEMYGKITGASRGKAGSMHLASPSHGLMASSAVVGTTIPLALGDALEARYNNKDRISVVIFGDGAVDEGVFWETLNAACLWGLPILFVCEDNGLAIHTHKKYRRGYKNLIDIIKQFNCLTHEDTGTDAVSIYETIKSMANKMRIQKIPALVNYSYYRYLEHVGVNEDFDAGYRSRDEFIQWQNERDPVNLLRKNLVSCGLENQLQDIERAIEAQITRSIVNAKTAPFPENKELYEGVYYAE